MAKKDLTRPLQVHEDQLLEAGHLISFRKEAALVFGLKRGLGKDTGYKLGGVPLRIGDLCVVQWGVLIPGTQLGLVTGLGRKGIIVRKWRGKGGWTSTSVSTAPDRILSRPDEKRLQKAAKLGAFNPWVKPLKNPAGVLMEAARQAATIPLGDGRMSILYGNPKSGKSSPPVYMLRDRYLDSDGTLRDRWRTAP